LFRSIHVCVNSGSYIKGEGSGEPTEPQPTPSPTQPSTGDQPLETSSSHAITQDSRDTLEVTNGNEGDQVQPPHDSPLSGDHTSDRTEGALNLQELSILCTNLSNRVLDLESIKDVQAVEISVQAKHLPPQGMVKEYHGMEYMETEEAVDEGRQSGETEEVKLSDDTEVVEDKGNGDKGGNAEELVITARPEVSTARPDIDAARQEDSVVEPRTLLTTTSIFDDEDITMAQKLIKMKEEKAKEKRSIAKDAEIARLIHEKELAKMEREREERQRQDQASVDYIASLYDEVQAKMDASEELAAILQMEEREMYTIKERHNQLNKKTFEEIQALYIKEQERDAYFVPIGSERDEKMIDKMNKKAAGMDEEEVPEEPDSTKIEVTQEGTKKRKLSTRKKMKSRKRRFRHGTYKGDKTDNDIEKENDKLRLCLTIISNEDKEVDYEILDKKYPIIEWKSEYHGIKPQFDETKDLEEININVVIRSNGQRRYFSTLMRVLSIFDREDLCIVYQLVMNRYQDETPEGFDRVLWGDLMIMFNPTDEDEFWNSQRDWNVMLELKLESEEDSTMALELIRFVKKLIAELEPENFDGDGKDL
ncbi:hypothetical protein Tco_1336969, partial [Tanacetum coccineum]